MTRVLVVDDEPEIRRTLATNLRARSIDVDLAASGEEALDLAATRTHDAVVLDLGLPGIDGIDGIDGIEVIERLRLTTGVPIIVLSVREHERDKVRALDAGADGYATKPFGIDELLARLRAALRRRIPSNVPHVVESERLRIGPRRETGARRTEPGAPDPARMESRRGARTQCRPARQPARAVAAGVGAAVRHRDQLPPRALLR
jgi:two-component system KDP operon response regulator KdpE